MPTLTDIANSVETVAQQLSSRVDEMDKEQKRLGEDLTSRTGAMAAEHKTVVDRMQAEIDRLTDELRELRLAASRPGLLSAIATGFDDPQQKQYQKSHRASFLKAVRAFGKLELLDEDTRKYVDYTRMAPEQKALYAGDATTGGFFASTDFIAELMQYILLVSEVRKYARVQTTAGEKVQMPSLQGDASAYWANEPQTFVDSTTPTLGMISISVHEIRGLLRVSQQNLEDSMFNLEDLIKTRLGLKFAQTEGAAFVNGDGNGKPRGFMSYPQKASSGYPGGSAGKNNVYDAVPYVQSTGTTGGKITADDVVNLLTDLKTAHAANSTFGFTRGTLGTLRLLKDSMSRPLWQPFAAANLPSTIYDRPYIEFPDMPEIATAATPIVLGDFSYYMIVDRISLNMTQLNELYIAQGLIGFIARMRVGADLLLTEAFRVLRCN